MSYRGFQFDRDNYTAPALSPAVDAHEQQQHYEDYGPPASTQPQRPRTAGATNRRTPAKSTAQPQSRRSPLSEEAARRAGEEGPVVLNTMDNRDRERYLDYMIHHDFEFQQNENGEFVATFKAENQAPSQPEPRSVPAPAPARSFSPKPSVREQRREVAPKTQTTRHAMPQSRARPLSWLLRMIADIYDDRFVLYTTEILTAKDISDFESFSSFIFNFLAKKFGLEKLKIQMSKELLMSVAAHRGSSPEVELFGVFLSGQYDAAALLFYLYCRWKVLPEATRGIKSEGRYHLQYIAANRFVALTKSVLAKQPPAMYSEFMLSLIHISEPTRPY
eukprot:TRINITY_DN33388_c0_g1_i2.p1 TRINITY_DN33388_c0_g1~~TRINITY_DN33388_c0_g1_i2.p1  ORF type:complete len:333 (+),score=60.09 TRINITY_DN33388_c0_g1_i2:184-1182(+)